MKRMKIKVEDIDVELEIIENTIFNIQEAVKEIEEIRKNQETVSGLLDTIISSAQEKKTETSGERALAEIALYFKCVKRIWFIPNSSTESKSAHIIAVIPVTGEDLVVTITFVENENIYQYQLIRASNGCGLLIAKAIFYSFLIGGW